MRLICLAALCAGLFGVAPGSAQSITGRVLDAETARPVGHARLLVVDSAGAEAGRASSDAEGRFAIELRSPGRYRLRADRVGYRSAGSDTVSVAMDEAVEVELRLSVSSVVLEPLEVTGRSVPPSIRSLTDRGFFHRRRTRPGYFLTRAEFERSSPARLTDILRRVPGVRIGTDQRGGSRITMGRSPSGCFPAVFVDNVPLVSERVAPVDALVLPDHVAAIEVYRGPSEVPGQFGYADVRCGAVVIWTRTDDEG